MRKLLFVLLLLFAARIHSEEVNITTPPVDLPVRVECSFYLLDLVSILDKEESFSADIYFSCDWKDTRLSFTPTEGQTAKVFLDESALDMLKTIWWPQIEFINAGKLDYTEHALFIYPDGKVEYNIALTGIFRSHLDLTKFPFDFQSLPIKIDSFLWNKNIVELAAAPAEVGFRNRGAHVHNDQKIVDIQVSTEITKGLRLKNFGNSDEFSTYVATISIERKSGFFVYQLFIPLFLVMGISCTVFFAYRSDFMQTIGISLASFLVFLAAKFTLNQDLPRVGYMTVIDKAFLVAYLSIGVSVVVCTLREIYGSKGKEWANRLSFHASWVVPLAFIVSIIWIFLL
ncbi:MAG: hypothetical protein JSR58_07195 [Verrucomicrobia bacterium]|nr:hypothetical protein [Verrucomicrobiota bacterium]